MDEGVWEEPAEGSAGVPTTSNVGPASSWTALIAMGVLEHAHPAVSAEVRRERAQGWYMAVCTCRSCVRLCTELLQPVINSGVPTQAEYVHVGHQCHWYMYVVPHHDTDLHR